MKRIIYLLSLFFLLFYGVSYAGGVLVNSGAGMTLGSSSNRFSLQAAQNNPAMGSLLLSESKKLRLSYAPVLSANIEVGDLDNFSEDLDDLVDIIKDPGATSDTPDKVLQRFNTVLLDMGDAGYAKNNISINIPLFPMYYRYGSFGVFGLGAKIGSQTALRVLDDPLSYDSQNKSFATASALYVKNGIETELSLSYSRALFKRVTFNSPKNTVSVGGKIKLINLRLSKELIPVQQLENANVKKIIFDKYDNNLEASTGVGLDLGVVWDSELFRIGLVLENINSPEFEYGKVGSNCTRFEENSQNRSSCESAAYFINNKGEIVGNETHTKVSMFRLDSLIKASQYWSLSMVLDLSEYNDIVGFDNRWINVAAAYDGGGNFLPSVRTGYQKNLTGSKTSSVKFGLTFFKVVALDLEYGLQSIEIDGRRAPRRLGFSLSLEESF